MALALHNFLISYIGNLKNIGSLRYASLPNVDIFHYTTSKTHIN